VLAMHHPPIPSPQLFDELIELRDQAELESVVQGSDVRGILAGHLHYSTHSTFAGIPVSVASATCYTNDPLLSQEGLRGQAGGLAFDIVHVYGGGRWAALRRVAVPSAVPSIFAALRISVPGAITGALLAEALATGTGLGYDVTQDAAQGQYDAVWAIVAVTTVVSLALYLLAQLLERLVMAEMGLAPR